MAGPLSPACVMRRGADSRRSVSGTETSAESTERPASSLSQGKSMWKVKREGTGGERVWPRLVQGWDSGRHPPAAQRKRSDSMVEPEVRRRVKPPSGDFCRDWTPWSGRIFTLAFCEAWVRQSMMVWEESVVGNIRPSDSVFSFTPRD